MGVFVKIQSLRIFWNYFSKDKSVEYVHGPWTGSTALESTGLSSSLNASHRFPDGELRLDGQMGTCGIKSDPQKIKRTVKIL
jgi:hypothetical protein